MIMSFAICQPLLFVMTVTQKRLLAVRAHKMLKYKIDFYNQSAYIPVQKMLKHIVVSIPRHASVFPKRSLHVLQSVDDKLHRLGYPFYRGIEDNRVHSTNAHFVLKTLLQTFHLLQNTHHFVGRQTWTTFYLSRI